MVELKAYDEWLIEKDIVQVDWKLQVTSGNFFIKHHRWGKPKLRHVWVDDGFKRIYWSDPNCTGNSKTAKGSMQVRDMKEVKEGLVKSRISSKDKKAAQRDQCTFSIISKSRTLELECPTQVTFESDLN